MYFYDKFCYPSMHSASQALDVMLREHVFTVKMHTFCLPSSGRYVRRARFHRKNAYMLLSKLWTLSNREHDFTVKNASKPRPQNSAQEAPESHFGAFPNPGRRIRPRKPPESHFGAFPSPGRRMGPGSLQKAILEHFQAQAAEWAQEAPRSQF